MWLFNSRLDLTNRLQRVHAFTLGSLPHTASDLDSCFENRSGLFIFFSSNAFWFIAAILQRWGLATSPGQKPVDTRSGWQPAHGGVLDLCPAASHLQGIKELQEQVFRF